MFLIQSFGWLPSHIANLTLEQMLLGFKDPESNENKRVVRCGNIKELQQILAGL